VGLTAPDGLYFVMCDIEIRDSWFSLYEGVESLVSCEQIFFMPLGEQISPKRGHQRGVPPATKSLFYTIGSSSGRTVTEYR